MPPNISSVISAKPARLMRRVMRSLPIAEPTIASRAELDPDVWVQAVAGLGVRAGEGIHFASRERGAERAGTAELVEARQQLLADLREAEVAVVDALDVQRDVGAGEGGGWGGGAFDLFDRSVDQLPSVFG